MADFMTAIDLRDMLEEVISKNPEAKVMMDFDNGAGYLVLDRISPELDSDGDARFLVRDYADGKLVEVLEVEEDRLSRDD